MRRRRLLHALGATGSTVAASGCLADTGSFLSDGGTIGPGATVTIGGTTFELGSPAPQVTFVDQQWPHWDARATDDHVYAALPANPQSDDSGAAEALRDATITAEVDGERVTNADATLVNRDDQPDVRLGVPFPTGDAPDQAAIVFEDAGSARYELDDDLRSFLADPPGLSVEPRIPDETDGNALTVSLDVTNDGSTRGILAWTTTHSLVADAWWTHRDHIPAGETRTVSQEWTRLGSPPTGEELTVRLDWGVDDRRESLVVARD
jgi:hypothetical protein